MLIIPPVLYYLAASFAVIPVLSAPVPNPTIDFSQSQDQPPHVKPNHAKRVRLPVRLKKALTKEWRGMNLQWLLTTAGAGLTGGVAYAFFNEMLPSDTTSNNSTTSNSYKEKLPILNTGIAHEARNLEPRIKTRSWLTLPSFKRLATRFALGGALGIALVVIPSFLLGDGSDSDSNSTSGFGVSAPKMGEIEKESNPSLGEKDGNHSKTSSEDRSGSQGRSKEGSSSNSSRNKDTTSQDGKKSNSKDTAPSRDGVKRSVSALRKEEVTMRLVRRDKAKRDKTKGVREAAKKATGKNGVPKLSLLKESGDEIMIAAGLVFAIPGIRLLCKYFSCPKLPFLKRDLDFTYSDSKNLKDSEVAKEKAMHRRGFINARLIVSMGAGLAFGLLGEHLYGLVMGRRGGGQSKDQDKPKESQESKAKNEKAKYEATKKGATPKSNQDSKASKTPEGTKVPSQVTQERSE